MYRSFYIETTSDSSLEWKTMPPGTGNSSGIFSFIRNKGTQASKVVICILFILLGIAHILFLIVQRIKTTQYLCKNMFLCSFWKLWYKKLCYHDTKTINVYTNLLWFFFFYFFSGLIFNLILEYDSNLASDLASWILLFAQPE